MRAEITALAQAVALSERQTPDLLAALNSLVELEGERRAALETALKTSANWAKVAEAMPVGLAVFDENGLLSCWNARFVAIYRLGETMRLGIPLAQVLIVH